ncbi:MAG: lysylphosphatidylglycerol synthase transmembrane domain-containing protein, partial [Peptostreptococcaceae bacterium]
MIKLTKKKALLQYGFLLFLIVLTTYLVYTTLDIKLIPHIIQIVNIKYLSLGIILMAIYIGIETYVTHIIISSIEKTKVKGISFKLATMGLYYNLVTPFASGSQPMQIYAMTKYNIKFSKAVAIVTNKTVIYQLVVTLYCGSLIMLNLKLLNKELPTILMLITVGMIINIGTLLVGILIIFNPAKMKELSSKIINKLCKLNLFKSLTNKKERIDTYIDEFHKSVMIFVKDKKSLMG